MRKQLTEKKKTTTTTQKRNFSVTLGGGVLLRIIGGGGVCRPVLQILTLFQTKTCHFPHPFSDPTSKINTSFQKWWRSQNATYLFTKTKYIIITEMRTPTKKYLLKCISNSHIMGLYLIHLEPIDKFVHTPT